jgi:cytochrome c oxidase assembly protein subunit 15
MPLTVASTARKSARFDPRFFSSNASTTQLPVLSSPGVGGWLLGSAGLVFAVIVVGGVTRLTESGLSITEWRPVSGTIPPLNQEEWMVEFEKYKATPEFKLYVISADSTGSDLN